MNLDELSYILQKGEGTTIEYKEAKNGVPKALYETIISFSNTDGGTIVLGADDDGNVIGVDANNSHQYIKEIVSTLHNSQSFRPVLFLEPVIVTHPNGEIIVIRVPASSQLHNYCGNVYWRSDDNDQNVTNNQQKIEDIIFQKRNYFSEAIIYPRLSENDLDPNLFDKARQIILAREPSHPWLSMNNQDLLTSACLYRKDFKTGEQGLTLAAALIFGKDITIHNLLPGYKVEAIKRVNDTDRHDDRLSLRTNLIDTYTQLLDFVKKHLNDHFYQEAGQRKDLRELIFREVVGNLIVHREYTNAHSSELTITSNKVTITNPNKALFHGPLDLEQFTPYPKNPNIRKFFTAFGWTDELGSGIRNTSKYLDIYVPGAKPVFIENDTFLTEIPLAYTSMALFADELVQLFNLNENAKQIMTDNLNDIPLAPHLSNADFKQLLLHLVPSWNQKGTKLESLDWPKDQYLSQDEIKQVPSWDEKGSKLFHKKVGYYIQILLLAIKPISLSDLMSCMNYKNRDTFRRNYLMPLQQADLLARTTASLNSPSQKYQITTLGIHFLTGSEQ